MNLSPPKKAIAIYFALYLSFFLISCEEPSEKIIDAEKSKAVQIYHLTEAPGKKDLTETMQTVTTAEAWDKRADDIRTHILKATDLLSPPTKHALNPILARSEYLMAIMSKMQHLRASLGST